MNEFSNNVIITQCRTDDLVPCGAIKYSPLAVLKIQAIWVCAKTVDFHCRWALSAGTASASSGNPTLRGLQTRAVPAGVATFRSNQQGKSSIILKILAVRSALQPSKWNMRDSWGR